MKRVKQSHLQDRILLNLDSADAAVKSLAELARHLNVQRTSVSRSMHALKDTNLVDKSDDGEWRLTDAGQVEVSQLREQAAQRAMAAVQDLAYLSRIASVSVSPFLGYIQGVEEQRSAIANTMAEVAAINFQKLLDEVLPNQALLEIAKVVGGRHDTVLQDMTSRYQTLLSKNLPHITFQEITTQQSALLDALQNLDVFDSYKEAMASTLMGTEQISALVEAMRPHLDTHHLINIPSLQDFIGALALPSLSETIARMGKIDLVCSRLIQEAASFATANQYLNNWALNMPDLAPNITRQLGQSGISISRTISAIASLKVAQPFDDLLLQLTPHVTEVTRTHLGFYANAISELKSEERMGVITLPGYVTADYVETIASIVDPPQPDEHEPWTFHPDINGQITSVLEGVGPQFLAMWNGAWETANSKNPDRLRQAAHSGRELLMQILAHLAPDNVFPQEEIVEDGKGQITHRMRLTKILAQNQSKSKWANAVADAVIFSLKELQGVSHYRSAQPPINQSYLTGMLTALGGLLIVCLQPSETSRK